MAEVLAQESTQWLRGQEGTSRETTAMLKAAAWLLGNSEAWWENLHCNIWMQMLEYVERQVDAVTRTVQGDWVQENYQWHSQVRRR